MNQRLLFRARQSNYELLVSDLGFINSLAPTSVDGAIFQGNVPETLVQSGFPAVSLTNDLRGPVSGIVGHFDVIQIVLEDAAREAMRHLHQQGARRIAYVSIPVMMNACEPRYRAYKTVMRKHSGAIEEIHVPSNDDLQLRDTTHQALQTYFAENGFPDALFCSCDDIAIGAYRALREMKRDIPRETMVVGCDDIEEAQDHNPALASLAWSFDRVSERAWQMLFERMAEPALPPRFEQIKAQFMPRASAQRGSTSAWSTPSLATDELLIR